MKGSYSLLIHKFSYVANNLTLVEYILQMYMICVQQFDNYTRVVEGRLSSFHYTYPQRFASTLDILLKGV